MLLEFGLIWEDLDTLRAFVGVISILMVPTRTLSLENFRAPFAEKGMKISLVFVQGCFQLEFHPAGITEKGVSRGIMLNFGSFCGEGLVALRAFEVMCGSYVQVSGV